jgi:SAM-dependent methyltransferase
VETGSELDARDAWDTVAATYYDELSHPRTAALRSASNQLLTRWASDLAPTARVLEVGAAAGLPWAGRSGVTAVDISARMLRLPRSRTWAVGVQADAVSLPFRASAFDVVVAALGAPFNSAGFWIEARRVLGPEGTVALTAPELRWAIADRGAKRDRVRFSDGASPVQVSSIVHSDQAQVELMTQAGLHLAHRSRAEATVLGASATVELWVAKL